MIRNGINFMLKPPRNLKYPICGKKCYLHERTGNYAYIDVLIDVSLINNVIFPSFSYKGNLEDSYEWY